MKSDSQFLREFGNTDSMLNKIKSTSPEAYDRIQSVLEMMSAEDRYYYVLGFIAGMECDNGKSEVLENVEKAVKKIPTKYTDRILEYLYENGNSYHGDLARADGIELSDSGLTAVIKKIEDCEIPVIVNSKEGKFKVYGLTDAGKKYIRFKVYNGKKDGCSVQGPCLSKEINLLKKENVPQKQIDENKTDTPKKTRESWDCDNGTDISAEAEQMDRKHEMRSKMLKEIEQDMECWLEKRGSRL